MPKLNDEVANKRTIGVLEAYKNGINGELIPLFSEHNLIVNEASAILRDRMLNLEDSQITTVMFGDMNLTTGMDLQNVAEPTVTDTTLIHSVFGKSITGVVSAYNGNPAILYEVTLELNECNGVGSQIITEYGLATSSGRLFSRKTRAAIFKDNETSLLFRWYLVFNQA